MAKLTTKERKKIPTKEFALPKERKYPVNDRSHAANAKARASEEERKGRLTKSQEREVDRAADRVLKGERKERRK